MDKHARTAVHIFVVLRVERMSHDPRDRVDPMANRPLDCPKTASQARVSQDLDLQALQ